MHKFLASTLNLGPILSFCIVVVLSGCGGGAGGGSEPLVTVAMSVQDLLVAETAIAQAKTLSNAGVRVSATKCYAPEPKPGPETSHDGLAQQAVMPVPVILYVHEIQLKDVSTAPDGHSKCPTYGHPNCPTQGRR